MHRGKRAAPTPFEVATLNTSVPVAHPAPHGVVHGVRMSTSCTPHSAAALWISPMSCSPSACSEKWPMKRLRRRARTPPSNEGRCGSTYATSQSPFSTNALRTAPGRKCMTWWISCCFACTSKRSRPRRWGPFFTLNRREGGRAL